MTRNHMFNNNYGRTVMKLTKEDLNAVAFALGIPAKELPAVAQAAARAKAQPKPRTRK